MRLCPTVEGSPSPLITHRIGVDVCQARQGSFFHKCHKCVYRGKPVDWEPEEPPHLTIELDDGARRNGTAAPTRKPAVKKKKKPRRRVAPGKVSEAEA